MARTHLRVTARPDVWPELVAYVILPKLPQPPYSPGAQMVCRRRVDCPRREWASGSLLARDK
jgi:hypothetical protein